jgi:hypothetical protein
MDFVTSWCCLSAVAATSYWRNILQIQYSKVLQFLLSARSPTSSKDGVASFSWASQISSTLRREMMFTCLLYRRIDSSTSTFQSSMQSCGLDSLTVNLSTTPRCMFWCWQLWFQKYFHSCFSNTQWGVWCTLAEKPVTLEKSAHSLRNKQRATSTVSWSAQRIRKIFKRKVSTKCTKGWCQC